MTAPPAPRLFDAVVVARTHLTPNMIRIRFGGDDLRHFVPAGPDQRVKVILAEDDPAGPRLAPGTTPKQILTLPEADRPTMRTYTVRNHHAAAGELDIDFAVHGTDAIGPATRFAQTCESGWRIALFGPVAAYAPPEPGGRQLLVGDETALPAIGAIAAALPAGARADVVVEVPCAADTQTLDSAAELNITWLPRAPRRAAAGELLTEAVTALSADAGYDYAWVACESSTAQHIRRFLVRELRIDKERIYFSGYWRHGVSLG